VAQKGRNVAGFARDKSIIYSYFFDKALKTSRQTATGGLFEPISPRFAQRAPVAVVARALIS
jgi:hypothetical protein